MPGYGKSTSQEAAAHPGTRSEEPPKWARHWGEQETPEAVENTALTANLVSHSWSYKGSEYGVAGKAAGSQGNPKTSLHQPFLLLIYGVGHLTTPGDGGLGIRAADGLWKGIPVMERAQKHPGRAGDTKELNLGEQRAPAKRQSWEQNSLCLETERWETQQCSSQRKMQEERERCPRGGNGHDPTCRLAHAELSRDLAQKLGMKAACLLRALSSSIQHWATFDTPK